MSHFDHEKLDVYHAAIDFVILGNEIIRHLPRGNSNIADQLQRAMISIPLNVAEGSGEYCRSDKARFYRYAKRSATECAAILDACKSLDLVDSSRFESGRDLLYRIVAMIIRMVRQYEKPGTGTRAGTGT